MKFLRGRPDCCVSVNLEYGRGMYIYLTSLFGNLCSLCM